MIAMVGKVSELLNRHASFLFDKINRQRVAGERASSSL